MAQQTAANSYPVVLASDQSITVTGGGDATAAKQDTQITSLQLIDDTVATAGSAITTKGQAVAGTDGTNARILKTDTSGELQIDVLTLPALIAGTAAIGKLAANNGVDIGDVDVTSISAGENHLGEVANAASVVTPTITASTSPAYTPGDSIGGKITLTSAVRVSGGVTILNSLMILDRANQKPTGTILIFNADPSAATLTDNAAFVYSTDDLKVVAAVPVASTDYTTINSKATANLSALAREVKVASGTSLYAAFVVTSTPTFAATTDVQIAFGFIHLN